MICTAVASDAILTIRTYGDTGPPYGRRLVRTTAHYDQQTSRSATRTPFGPPRVSQVSHWVLAAWGSRETGAV
jgi:hypothetical protein